MALPEWSEKEFDQFMKDKGHGLVEFSAPWCGACKMTEPILTEIAEKHPHVVFAKIDVSKNPGLASRMGVMSLPNVIFFNGGGIKDQVIGAASRKTLEEKVKKYYVKS